jgi:MoxR-like ATPase
MSFIISSQTANYIACLIVRYKNTKDESLGNIDFQSLPEQIRDILSARQDIDLNKSFTEIDKSYKDIVAKIMSMTDGKIDEKAVPFSKLKSIINRHPNYQSLLDKLKAVNIQALPQLVQKDISANAASDSPEKTDEKTSYIPEFIDLSAFETSRLSSFDVSLRKITNNKYNSFASMLKQVEEIQTFAAAKLKSAGNNAAYQIPAIPNSKIPSGHIESKLASDVFSADIPPEMVPLFNFPVYVGVWDGEHPDVPKRKRNYQLDPEELHTLLWSFSSNRNSAVVGPPGCGKTVGAEVLAQRLNRPFYRVPCDGEMRRRELIGGFKQIATEKGSETIWFDGLLTKAIQQPSILLIDEIDRADPDLLYTAHQALERNGITILDDEGRYIPHNPHCIITSTANTKGKSTGEDHYQLRTEMSEATRDRLHIWLDKTYMKEDAEVAQLQRDFPALKQSNLKTVVRFANLMRNAFMTGMISTTCSYRQLETIGEYLTTMATMFNGSSADHEKEAIQKAITISLIKRAPLPQEEGTLVELLSQIGI